MLGLLFLSVCCLCLSEIIHQSQNWEGAPTNLDIGAYVTFPIKTTSGPLLSASIIARSAGCQYMNDANQFRLRIVPMNKSLPFPVVTEKRDTTDCQWVNHGSFDISPYLSPLYLNLTGESIVFEVKFNKGCPAGMGCLNMAVPRVHLELGYSYDTDGVHDCCTAQRFPNCNDQTISACVCDSDPSCCETEWNATCVGLVKTLGCGVCGAGPCCNAHATKGCQSRQTTSCVCLKRPDCCSGVWGPACVKLAAYDCKGCPVSNCCVAHDHGGCDNEDVEKCVCAIDPFCCQSHWDAGCVKKIETYNCSSPCY